MILDMLKSWFPKPTLQKRYVAMLGGVLYAVAFLYVRSTPSVVDDEWLENVKQASMVVFAANDDDGEPDGVYPSVGE